MASFGTHAISYDETRADGGHGWHVSYHISSSGGHVDVALKVHLTDVEFLLKINDLFG